jgi:hypothetical protein
LHGRRRNILVDHLRRRAAAGIGVRLELPNALLQRQRLSPARRVRAAFSRAASAAFVCMTLITRAPSGGARLLTLTDPDASAHV